VNRFIEAGRADHRILAAFLGGSYARGTADQHSDLDLGLIATDAAYDDVVNGLREIVGRIGEPVFLESFGLPYVVFFIFADGTECELVVGRQSAFQHIHDGPYRILLDKANILTNAAFAGHKVPGEEQEETLRRLTYWFWHDLSHFTTAMARHQLWWAHGQLDVLRLVCVNLARLEADFLAAADGFDKVDIAVPPERLAPLKETFCPIEADAMLRAAHVIVRFYRDLTVPLARTHGIPYPEALDGVMSARLEQLRTRTSS
jgi:hypothetical protein